MRDLIDRQEAIEALGEEPEVWSGKDEYEMGLNNQWHYDRNAIMEVPTAEPRWIPVTEHLPKERVNVLITYIIGNNRYTGENCIEDGKWGIEGLRFLYPDIEVLAWMQKPTPWKGE